MPDTEFLPRCHLKRRIRVCTLLLVLLVLSCLNVKAVEPQTAIPLADTFVEASSPNSSENGRLDYLKVQETSINLSFTFLMFDLSGVSHSSNVSLETKLRLRSIYVSLPFKIGARWCVSNAWNEDTLTFVNLSYFYRTAPEYIVIVSPGNAWYEWDVTGFVRTAMRENYEKITLVLEANETVEGNFIALFYSKDQQDTSLDKYSPQLVFTYHDIGEGVSSDMIGKVILGVLATVGVVFVAYRFLKNSAKKRRRHFSSVR